MLGPFELLWGAIFSLALALTAFKGGSLSIGGTIAAVLLGAFAYWFGGWQWFVLLAVFFLSSSWFTKYKEAEKQGVSKEFANPGPRDVFQVLANGALASLAAVIHYFWPEPALFVLFAGVIASVNADTWATELGILSKAKPRLMIAWKKVAVGTSGAVSLMGTVYAFAGALFIGAWAGGLTAVANGFGGWVPALAVVAAVGVGGLVGSLADSLFGATVQVMYRCPKCRKETERRIHKCGSATRRLRGFDWFDNDVVNLASSIAGGLVAAGLFGLLSLFLKP
ncbi:MAG: DUF92 domain-containing protein [Candidatus Micrarchaeota archaeon]|nr:DUF92 domain-containing protein [Candidatus Micrarchaeota archaeon]